MGRVVALMILLRFVSQIRPRRLSDCRTKMERSSYSAPGKYRYSPKDVHDVGISPGHRTRHRWEGEKVVIDLVADTSVGLRMVQKISSTDDLSPHHLLQQPQHYC